MTVNNTTRFSNRAELYARYRPGYPSAVMEHIKQSIQLTTSMLVADIGSGTGISSELFLKQGNTVYGVEPNDAMRKKAEASLQQYPHFVSRKGTAEQTGLPAGSIDIIFAGQAFHWFNQAEAKVEFRRIAKPASYILLMWNVRSLSTPFAEAYEQLLAEFGTEYFPAGRDVAQEEKNIAFFTPCAVEKADFQNTQAISYEVLRGRTLSTSWLPPEEDERSVPMLAKLQELFDRYQQNGYVQLDYTTTLFSAKAHC